MIIRPITALDLPAVHEMIVTLAAHHGDVAAITLEDMTRDMLGDAPWVRVLVAQDTNGLQAYAALLPLAKIADGRRGMDINHMFVREEYRGQGLGRQLIDASIAVAGKLGCTYAFIGTSPTNTDAQSAYLACGFERWPDSGPRFRKLIAA